MADEKKELVRVEKPAEFKFPNEMAQEPIIAPDGHEVLSQEDIDARDASAES